MNKGDVAVHIQGVQLVLLSQKMLYLPEYELLCLADWHLGKAAHFRRAGIPVPQPDLQREFDVVFGILKAYPVRSLLFLGDLFHSTKNNDWDFFVGFADRLNPVSATLIKGNHDIISSDFFDRLGIPVLNELVVGDRILFTHEPLFDKTPPGLLNIAGHVHPGYRVFLKARQGIALPCFHYSKSTLLLPAFGELTGLHMLEKVRDQAVFCVVGDEVVAV